MWHCNIMSYMNHRKIIAAIAILIAIFVLKMTLSPDSFKDLRKQLIGDDVDHPETTNCLNASRRFQVFPSGHRCLHQLANKHCYDTLPVPNLVHYVYFNTQKFYFYNLLSILSSYRILKPCFIYLHGNNIPSGKWWSHMLDLVPNIVFVKMHLPTNVFQRRVKVIQHVSDVARLRILLEYGGIYMDFDVLALRSFDPLRKHFVTLAPATLGTFNNAVIIANKDSPFLHMWYLSYADFKDERWNYHSCQVPYKLYQLLPGLVHSEKGTSLFNFRTSIKYVFKELCDWSNRYGIHLLYRHVHAPDYDPYKIKNLNTSFGEIARFIYYQELPVKRHVTC